VVAEFGGAIEPEKPFLFFTHILFYERGEKPRDKVATRILERKRIGKWKREMIRDVSALCEAYTSPKSRCARIPGAGRESLKRATELLQTLRIFWDATGGSRGGGRAGRTTPNVKVKSGSKRGSPGQKNNARVDHVYRGRWSPFVLGHWGEKTRNGSGGNVTLLRASSIRRRGLSAKEFNGLRG